MSCSATMTENHTVYYGPSTVYPVVGSVYDNEAVTVLWQEESWFHIEYSVGTKKKRGYVKTSSLALTGSVPNLSTVFDAVRDYDYISDGGTTYTGPNPSVFYEAGSLDVNERVIRLPYYENGYCYVEYSYGGTARKRAYYPLSKLTFSDVT